MKQISAQDKKASRHLRSTAFLATGLAFFMLSAAFAAVPLYDLFCRVTGFGGTPMIVTQYADKVLERKIEVKFDANVSPQMNWKFSPESPSVNLKIGQAVTITYRTSNDGKDTQTGIATFNVSPAKAAPYFNKIACFCFTDKTLSPGQVDVSEVTFYIDPAIAEVAELKDLSVITLSYTFFPSKNQQPVAAKMPISMQESLDKYPL